MLRPPPPRESLEDVGAAVREALRVPARRPAARRSSCARRHGDGRDRAADAADPGGRTPGRGTRRSRPSPTSSTGSASTQVTILVAGGLLRRPSPREIGLLVPPEFRRRFRGRVIVHDAEAEDLVELGAATATSPLRVNPALVETDLVVTVTAAETVLHGGPAALLAACGREALRAAGALSLLETSASQGWELARRARAAARGAGAGHRRLARAQPAALAGPFAGYPYDEEAIERMLGLARAPALPARARPRPAADPRARAARADRRGRVRRHAVGRAHRGAAAGDGPQGRRARRAARRDRDRHPADDAVPAARAAEPGHRRVPRARPRAAPLAQRAADRRRRHGDPRPPTSRGASRARRRRRTARSSPTRGRHATATRCARPSGRRGRDTAGLADYRAGRACHPLQPFVDWSACDAVTHRLGAVLVAGCRDAHAARQLGFVPVHSLGAALEMARGRGARRIGYLLSPPYFPLVVGADETRSLPPWTP